ncbi:MAG TPA: hypothetical protein VI653_29200, partial [Steroidobacteraceae bacterium]
MAEIAFGNFCGVEASGFDWGGQKAWFLPADELLRWRFSVAGQLLSETGGLVGRQTPLFDLHRELGARIVDFGGWDMPVQYPAGTMTEHLRCRTHAGLFDVSHMGEIEVRGADAIAFVNRLVSNDASKLVDGQAQYSALTTPAGTVIDDLLVYRFSA